MSSKNNYIKRTLNYNKEEYEELTRRAKFMGTTPSKIIRQLIAEFNLKPFLAEFKYKTINNTREAKTLLEQAKNDE